MHFVLLALAAISFAACGSPAGNAPANANANSNSNANAAKPVATAPTADDLLAFDKQATEAYLKGDGKFFETFLSDKFAMYEGGHRVNRADTVGMISKVKCDVKDSKLEEPQISMIDADTYVLTYKNTTDATCNDGPGGKVQKIPSPTRSASVYVRSGDRWLGVFHGENPIIDPNNPPKAAPPAPPAKKEEAKKDAKAPSNSNRMVLIPMKPSPDDNTDSLVKLHTAGWEAFMAKNAKKFDELLSTNFVNVNPIGGLISGKANAIKTWTETMKCEGMTKTSVSDGFASAISPTVEMFTLKGNADGTCDGQKNGDIYQSTVYVKEGEAWKLAFMFESLAM
jgi:hypothetical protein